MPFRTDKETTAARFKLSYLRGCGCCSLTSRLFHSKRNDEDASKSVARHLNLPNNLHKHIAVRHFSPSSDGKTETRKT